jgi:NAD(P)H-dependent FMN reductase
MQVPRILAISGSTRKGSVNSNILRAIATQYKEQADWILYEEIDTLPHFNPDLDLEPFPPAVNTFRELIQSSDAVVICTPEYVFSLPGSLKNALEWTVSTTLFTDKPAALITASSSGDYAFASLEKVMRTLGVIIPEKCNLLIKAPKTKLDIEGNITDPETKGKLNTLAEHLLGFLSQPQSL